MRGLGVSGALSGLLACSGPAPLDDVGRFTVSGAILDLNDDPVVDVFVTVSTEFCIPDRTTSDGAFSVGEVDAGDKRLITYGETASDGPFASVVFAFEAEQAMAFDTPIYLPKLDESWPVDVNADVEQIVTSQAGLTLTLPVGALTLAPFAPSEVQLARVPLDRAPPFAPNGVELIDLFVLHPIQSTLDPPAPVLFPADTGLSPGTTVLFHSLNYDTGQLVPVANGTVNADGRPTTADGQGLPELTWVGVSLD